MLFRSVDTGCLVALTQTVDYDVVTVGGVKSMIFGGEGVFFARLRGPGHVWLQSLPFSRLAGRIMANIGPAGRRTDEGSVLGVLGNLTNASLSRQVPTASVSPSYLTVYPSPGTPSTPPLIANLNSVEGAPVGNLALVKYGADQVVRIYNARGYAHYVLDVNAVVLSD